MGLHDRPSPRYRFARAYAYIILWLIVTLAPTTDSSREVTGVNGPPSPNVTETQDALSSADHCKDCHCTMNRAWTVSGSGYEIIDCFNARYQFWQEKVVTHPRNRAIEYLGVGAEPTTRLEKLYTPVHWTNRKGLIGPPQRQAENYVLMTASLRFLHNHHCNA